MCFLFLSSKSNTQIRNLFVKNLYNGKEAGADTFLHDVMRGRDGGLRSFIDYFPLCLSRKIECWCDLKAYFEKDHFELLRKIYKNFKDIELMVGVLLEKRYGNEMGKIGGCIVAEQFYRHKYGDRFFYSHPNGPYPFTKSEFKLDLRNFFINAIT